MKNLLLIYSLLILAVNSSAQTLPELNQSWLHPTTGKDRFFIIGSGMYPSSRLNVGGIDFDIVTEKDKVKYIGTNDKKFEIDGVKYVGLKLSDFKNKADVKKYLGWGHYLPIKDGWYALFDFKDINDSSKVVAVFRYQFSPLRKALRANQTGFIVFTANKASNAAIQYIDKYGKTQLLEFGKMDTIRIRSNEPVNILNVEGSAPTLYRCNVNDTIYLDKDKQGKQFFYSQNQGKNAQLKYMNAFSKFMGIFSKRTELPDVDGGKAELLRRVDSLGIKNILSEEFMLEEEANLAYIQYFNYLNSKKALSPAEIDKLSETISNGKFIYLIPFKTITKFYITQLLKKEQNNAQAVADLLNEKYEGNIRNLLLFQLLADSKVKLPRDILSKYLSNITDADYHDFISKNLDLEITKQLYKDADDVLLDMSGQATKLKDLISLHLGQVIYIDVWASWCAPCLAQMEQSKKLSQEFKNIEFLYFSIDKNRTAWEDKVKGIPLSLSKNFLFINGTSTKFLKQLGVKEIPRYIIIDKSGKIINQDAPRPVDTTLRDIFNTLMKEK